MFITITCPHCQEDFGCQLDCDESSEFIVDCEICCRPMTVKARMQSAAVGDNKIVAFAANG